MTKRNIGFLTFFILVLIVTGIWIIEIVNGDIPYVDQWTRALVGTFPGTGIYTFFELVSNLGSSHFLIPFAIIVIIFLIVLFRDWLPSVVFALAVVITRELNNLIKGWVGRERPTFLGEANAVGESFPSGHAMVSIVCYGLIAYFLSKKIKSKKLALLVQILFAFLVFLIGISRYIISVHYLTDIVAGYVFGYICLLLFIYLYEYIQRKRSRS